MDRKSGYKYQTAAPYLYGLLKRFARENRRNMTEAESVLWNNMVGGRLGTKFKSQYIIGEYIVDFVSLEKKLVIEVDGAYHSEPHQARYDDIPTAYMHRQGFQVIRFTNEEILFNIEGTLDRIRNIILYYITFIILTPLTPSDNSPFRG